MRRIFLLIIAFVVFAACGIAGAMSGVQRSTGTSPALITDRILPERERLVFKVKWMGILAGEIISEIKGIEEFRGRKVYRIEVTARTVGICSKLYRVEDKYVSYWDVERRHSLRHEVSRREGGYRKDAVIDFDQDAHQAHFKSFTDGSEKTFPIPPDTQDTITAGYLVRTMDLVPGKEYGIKVCNSEKNYDVFFSVAPKKAMSVADVGRREVFRIQPFARLGQDRVREGRMHGFIDSETGLPYLIVIQAPVFTKLTAFLRQ